MAGYGNCNLKTNGERRLLERTIKPRQVIFDVGANVGEWTDEVLSIEPSVTIYAFEPHPAVCAQLQAAHPGVHCLNLALSAESTTKELCCWGAAHSAMNGLYYRPQLAYGKTCTRMPVECTTLDAFCDANGINHIDLLKIDTEGSELDVLRGADRMLDNINVIQFEYGGTYRDAGITLETVFALLSHRGFKLARLYSGGELAQAEWSGELETYQYCNYVARRAPVVDQQANLLGE